MIYIIRDKTLLTLILIRDVKDNRLNGCIKGYHNKLSTFKSRQKEK